MKSPPPVETEGEVTSEIPPRDVENAVYNDQTDLWMIPQADPYSLENFQKAYDNLAAGKSLQKQTRAEASEFSEGEKLEPTHYALRIYPKTEEEQWRVEMMEDVSVVYTPLDYAALTPEEATRVPRTRAEVPSPFEVNRYSVTYDNEFVTDGGPTEPQTFQLPILYAVWPVEKPLPNDLEFVLDYEVFLPHEVPQTRSAMEVSILEAEAIALALGLETTPVSPATRAAIMFNGVILVYDDVVARDVPIANLKVRYSLGSSMVETSTDSGGVFIADSTLPPNPNVVGIYMDFDCVYQDPLGKWKITNESSTTPLSVSIKQAFLSVKYPSGIFLPPGTPSARPVVLPEGDRQANEIHRAADFFYGEASPKGNFPRYTLPSGLRIMARNGRNALSPTAKLETYLGFYDDWFDRFSIYKTLK